MYKVDHSILSLPLSSLFKSTCLNMSYTDLLVKCENVFQDLTISKQQCKNIEVSTRDQAQYPYLGASPDGYVEYLGCGPGVIEVKCPFSSRDKSLLEATGESVFCLETAPDGNYILKPMHSYHYQVQLQIKLCHVLYNQIQKILM